MHIGLIDTKWRGHHTPYVIYLSKYLINQDYQITFITDERNPHLKELPDRLHVRTRDFPTTAGDAMNLRASIYEQFIRTRQLRQISNIADDEGFDVIHLLYFDRTQIPLWVISRIRETSLPPIVATLHRDAFTDSNNAKGTKRLTLGATTYALDRTLADGTLDYLTVHADSIRDRIIEIVGAATTENTKTIPAPTPELSTETTPKEARDELDLPQDVPLFLFFGGLRNEKGPDLLAEALQDIEQPLAVVFAGSEVDYTKNDIERWRSDITEHVRAIDRLEYVPEEEVELYFLAADVLVLPYRRTRGISGPLRRACMAGTPTIGWSESDIGQIIERHDLGWTFDAPTPESVSEALTTALDEYDGPNEDSLEAFAHSRHWRETGKSLEKLYRSLSESEPNQKIR